MLTWFILRILILVIPCSDVSQDMHPFVASAPPQPPYTLFLNANFPDSDPLRFNSGSEEPHLPLPTGCTVLKISSFTDPHGTVARKQWDELIEHRSHMAPIPTFAPRWFEIPQMPHTHGDRQWNFKRSEPISFIVDGLPGKRASQAIHRSRWPGRPNLSKRG